MKFLSTLFVSCLLLLQTQISAQTIVIDSNFNTFDNNQISIVNGLVKQSGKLILVGSFGKIAGVKCKNICRLLNDSVVDPTFNSGKGFNNDVNKIVVLPGNKLMVMGAFTTYSDVNINYLMRLNADGTPDLSFVPNFDFGSVLNDFVVQPDGMVVVVGKFTTYSGYARKNIVRLKANGNLDLSFNCGDINNGDLKKVLLQSTGKIILTGEFDAYQSQPASSIVRLMSNGDVDQTFSCVLKLNYKDMNYRPYAVIRNIHVHENDEISISHDGYPYDDIFYRYNSDGGFISKYPFLITAKSIFLQNGNILNTREIGNGYSFPQEVTVDGTVVKQYAAKGWMGYLWDRSGSELGNITYPFPMFEIDSEIYVCGSYYENYTNKVRRFVRLGNTEIDPTFLPSGGPNFSVTYMAKYSTNKLVLLGGFSRIGTKSARSIVIVDSMCNIVPGFDAGTGFNGPALCMAVQPDGKIIVGGDFTSYNNQTANRLVRLMPDGAIDPAFIVGAGPDYPVYDIQLIDTDKILIAGVFGTYQGADASNIIFLNQGGSINTTLNVNIGTGTNGRIRKLHRNGNYIYVIGDFNYYNGNLRKHIVRINLDGSFDPSFDVGQGDNGLLNDAVVLGDKIYVVGQFTSFSNFATSYMARLKLNGSIDNSFVMADYNYTTLPGFNIDVIDSTLLYTGVEYTASNDINGTKTTTFNGFTLKEHPGYWGKRNLFNGIISYWPETSTDSGNYYFRHLKVFVDGNDFYFYGSTVDDNSSLRGSFIEKYKYIPPQTTGNGGGGNPNVKQPDMFYSFSGNTLILNDINNSKGVLYLTDIDGSVINEGDYQTNTGIDIQSLDPGMYFIKYINENQTDVTIIKLVINP